MNSIREFASCWGPILYSGLCLSMTCTTVRGISRNGLMSSSLSCSCSIVIGIFLWDFNTSCPFSSVLKRKQWREIVASISWLLRASATRNINANWSLCSFTTAHSENRTILLLGLARESFAKKKPRSDVVKRKPARDWRRRQTTASGHWGVIWSKTRKEEKSLKKYIYSRKFHLFAECVFHDFVDCETTLHGSISCFRY